MHDTCAMWSLPWHELQKNLALGLGGSAIVQSAALKRTGAHSATAVICANSWLGRARLRAAPMPNRARS
jgi:hypothetical protein